MRTEATLWVLVFGWLFALAWDERDCRQFDGPRAVRRGGHCWAPDDDGKWRMVDVPWEQSK